MKHLEGVSLLEPHSAFGSSLRVVVATTGGDDSRGAVDIAASLSNDRGAAVMAITVVEPSARVAGHTARAETPFEDETRCEVPKTVERALGEVRGSERWTKRAIRGW